MAEVKGSQMSEWTAIRVKFPLRDNVAKLRRELSGLKDADLTMDDVVQEIYDFYRSHHPTKENGNRPEETSR